MKVWYLHQHKNSINHGADLAVMRSHIGKITLLNIAQLYEGVVFAPAQE